MEDKKNSNWRKRSGTTGKHWSYAEIKFLEDNYCQMTNRQMAEKLGRSMLSVMSRLRFYGLVRPKHVIAARKNAGQFKTGLVPWNKDLKGIRLSPATEFKKGNLPAQTKYDGCIRKRRHGPSKTDYFYIRISQSKWKPLHHYNWEKLHGKIPPKHIVAFKDGNSTNPNIENLVLMSRADNVRRNYDPQKTGATLKKKWDSGELYHDRNCLIFMSREDRELREELKKHPELIQLKKAQLKHRRALNERRKD